MKKQLFKIQSAENDQDTIFEGTPTWTTLPNGDRVATVKLEDPALFSAIEWKNEQEQGELEIQVDGQNVLSLSTDVALDETDTINKAGKEITLIQRGPGANVSHIKLVGDKGGVDAVVTDVTDSTATIRLSSMLPETVQEISVNGQAVATFETKEKSNDDPVDPIDPGGDFDPSALQYFDKIVSSNWVLDNDEPNGGILNRPNLIKNGCVRLYLFGYDISDGNPDNLYLDPTQGFGGKYKISDLVNYFNDNGVHVQLSFRDNPEFIGYKDGPQVYPQGSDTKNPDNYQKVVEFTKKCAEFLQGKGCEDFSIAFGNEFMEHWKSDFEDWDPEEIGALFVALEKYWPKGTRNGVAVGSAGDVAWDTNQFDRIVAKLREHNVDFLPVDWYQVHIYWNQSHATRNDYELGIDFSGKASMPEEHGGLRDFATRMIQYIHAFDPKTPVRLGEFGYDAGYPFNPVGGQDDGSPNIIWNVPNKPEESRDTRYTKAEGGVRSFLHYAMVPGMEYAIWYTWDNVWNGGGGWLFGSCGFVDGDNTIFLPVWYYVQTARNVLKGYKGYKIVREDDTAWHYIFKNDAGDEIHAVWENTRNEGSNKTYTFPVDGVAAIATDIIDGDEDGIQSDVPVNNGQVSVQINGTPTFIKVLKTANTLKIQPGMINTKLEVSFAKVEERKKHTSHSVFMMNAKQVVTSDRDGYTLTGYTKKGKDFFGINVKETMTIQIEAETEKARVLYFNRAGAIEGEYIAQAKRGHFSVKVSKGQAAYLMPI